MTVTWLFTPSQPVDERRCWSVGVFPCRYVPWSRSVTCRNAPGQTDIRCAIQCGHFCSFDKRRDARRTVGLAHSQDPVPNSPTRLCGRKATLNHSQFLQLNVPSAAQCVTLGRWPTDTLLRFKQEKLEMIRSALFKDQSQNSNQRFPVGFISIYKTEFHQWRLAGWVWKTQHRCMSHNYYKTWTILR